MKKCTYSHYSSAGGRENNEDFVIALEKKGAKLFAVADGLGGESGGETASEISGRELKRQILSSKSFVLEDAVRTANEMITLAQLHVSDNPLAASTKKMKTTCAAVYVDKSRTVTANVGDSRIYLLSEEKIVFRSHDHSAAQMLVDLGEITQDELRDHPDKNVLTRALGAMEGDELKIDANVIDNASYCRLLICSDGFWEYVFEDEMLFLSRDCSPSEWLSRMRLLHDERAPLNCDNNSAVTALISPPVL